MDLIESIFTCLEEYSRDRFLWFISSVNSILVEMKIYESQTYQLSIAEYLKT